MNMPAIVHPARPVAPARARHAGVGVVNNIIVITKVVDRLHGDRDRLGLHQSGEPHAVHPGRDDLHDARRRDTHVRRHHGHPRCRRRGVLRLHRVRRRIDRRAGSEESKARHADRHPRLARHLHGALRVVLARAQRRRDGRRFPHAGKEASVALRDLEVHGRATSGSASS